MTDPLHPNSDGSAPVEGANSPVEYAVVKWYSPKKGYGFVLVADPKNGVLSDLFLYVNVVREFGRMVESQQTLLIERGYTLDGRTCVARIHKIVSDGPIIKSEVGGGECE